MLQKLHRKWIDHETMSYLVCGVLTTVVDWLVFWVMDKRCLMDYRVSTALSWAADT